MFFNQPAAEPLIRFTLAPLREAHGIPLAVMGVLVVFLALLLVAAFITLLPRVLDRLAPPPANELAEVPAVDDDEIPEETLVVIAAAVAAVVDKPHRVVVVRGLTPDDLGWSLEGRIQLHQSHRIQHRERR